MATATPIRSWTWTHRIASLLAIAVLPFAAGCVTKSRFEHAVTERDDYLAQKQLLELRNEELAVRLESASNEMLVLDDQLERNEETLAQIEDTYGELVDQLASEVEAGKIQIDMMQSGLNIRIDDEILFDSGSASLDTDGRKVLERLAGELGTIPYQVVVAGYSDNVPIGESLAGRYPTNWDLAGARSARVVAVLQAAGLPSEQLLSVSFGSNAPLASNATADGRARNRRIELRIRPVRVEADNLPDVAAPPPWE